ncbi:MAG: MerR family transcriptional regulator [Deltaproteobacteria bacterium]|jgi:DNA-binding transcriptional MerR regulator|nr:MerR family transcriptional regulator [Deltaproteobacteria bacterium]
MKNLPEGQLLFKLGEAAENLSLEVHVLRYWEREFRAFIKPLKMGSRKRLYSKEDLETFKNIKHLLYEERFTIEGAKKQLAALNQPKRNKLFDYVEDLPPEDDLPNENINENETGNEPLDPSEEAYLKIPKGLENPSLQRELLTEIRHGLLSLRELLVKNESISMKKNPDDKL